MKSKSVNLWPIQCFIIELPPKLRYCFAYILVCGLLWCPEKSNLKIFQERFVSELEQTQNFQVQIKVDSVNIVIERINLHGHLADLVSKAPYLCFCQFSGKNECSVCLHPRERVQQRRGSIHIYPYKNQEPPCWTHAQTLLHARTAERTKEVVFGVKGVSSLPRVLKVPSQVFLNYMHLVRMGEFLRRLNIWINNQSDSGFLSQSYEAIDHAMMNVKFPHDFNRKLRPLSKVKR